MIVFDRMMISVLIPIYNFNILPLIEALQKQFQQESAAYEILVADDKSDFIYQQQTPDLTAYPKVQFLFPEQKLGRARIRNYLARHATGDYLLFLDCDSTLEQNPSFIHHYLNIIQKETPNLVVGGRIYPEKANKNQQLHWLYGSKTESIPLKKRIKKPHHSLMTNNLLVKRAVWENTPFDEDMVTYGHEDTLFGILLEEKGIQVSHTDNPVVHGQLEDNLTFLTKTEVALTNILLLEQKASPVRLQKHIRLYKLYRIIRKLGLFPIILLIAKKTKASLRKRIISKPDLKTFFLYKILFFIAIKSQS